MFGSEGRAMQATTLLWEWPVGRMQTLCTPPPFVSPTALCRLVVNFLWNDNMHNIGILLLAEIDRYCSRSEARVDIHYPEVAGALLGMVRGGAQGMVQDELGTSHGLFFKTQR